MPIQQTIKTVADQAVDWRRDIHRHPELQYDVHRTAAKVAGLMREFGCDEVVEGIGRTGVVGVIRGRAGARVIGLRADMDALPIHEASNVPYMSTNPGKMHACGHDGHTAMLLGAAKVLAETRDFTGSAVLVFQPAEEGGAGGKAMLDDGLMERFGIEEVYGLHNMPGLAPGHFAICPGPIMACSDVFDVEITGRGAHAAKPHESTDPVLVAAHIVTGLQSIAARNTDPLKSAVVSVTALDAGNTYNVIPDTARLRGTCRALEAGVQDMIEKRLTDLCEMTARAFGAHARVSYRRNYPVTVNHARQTQLCAEVAAAITDSSHVDTNMLPIMGAEDFSFMLEARPGAFMFIGNGDSAGLHNPAYDFNDDIIATGIRYWAKLVQTRLV